MNNKANKGNLIKHIAKNERDFTILNNELLRKTDPPVSLDALGVIWRIKSLSETWNFNQKGFAKMCGCSIGKVANIMKTLEKLGCMKIQEIRNKNGQFKSYEYHFYETQNPKLLKEPKEEVSNIPNTEKPKIDNPNSENQASYKESINKVSNDIKSNDIENKAQSAMSQNNSSINISIYKEVRY